MTNTKNTKRALLGSVLALLLCVSMLVGTTFAWFTDSVTSAGNKIQAGTLDVELYLWNGANDTDKVAVSGMTDSIFKIAQKAQNSAETLWEPGKTQVVYLSIKNNGTLDLKYKVALNVMDADAEQNLYEVMQYAIKNDAKYGDVDAWDGTNAKSVELGINATQANDVALGAGQEHFFALSVHMEESAGNKYQGGQVDFDIKVLAAQLASESDSFDATYDELATYDKYSAGFGQATGDSAFNVYVYDEDNATKMGYVSVSNAALENKGAGVTMTMEESSYTPNITVNTGIETKTYDISVSNLNGQEEVSVSVFVGEQLDPATVSVYHYDTLMDSLYDPTTGYVSFETKDFSPFTLAYDAESEYVPPVIDGDIDTDGDGDADLDGDGDGNVDTDGDTVKLPVANVVRSPEYENTDLDWGNYGAWSPTEGLDSHLEAAYTFSCKDTPAEAEASPFAYWYCDFYVKLSKNLNANEIFLGGNYGSFGWVGFHNGDLTLEANTEIPLLGSVTSNPWTYAQVANAVGTFICGVGDVDDALKGETFTVMLRLTNPENENEHYDVATINYTFE